STISCRPKISSRHARSCSSFVSRSRVSF
ncbi:MAG: hypothetical protein AVDCRST_MAG26-1597, partial [uncultured Chloroflexia bacterium]